MIPNRLQMSFFDPSWSFRINLESFRISDAGHLFQKQIIRIELFWKLGTLKSLIDKHALLVHSYVLSEHAHLLGTSEYILLALFLAISK